MPRGRWGERPTHGDGAEASHSPVRPDSTTRHDRPCRLGAEMIRTLRTTLPSLVAIAGSVAVAAGVGVAAALLHAQAPPAAAVLGTIERIIVHGKSLEGNLNGDTS